MAFDILTFGEVHVEIVRSDTASLAQRGTFYGPYPGGPMLGVAFHAARLGATVEAVTCVGDDAFGKSILDEMESVGIETSHVRRLPRPTSMSLVAYGDGASRDLIDYVHGSAAEFLTTSLFEASMFEELRLVHLFGSTAMLNDLTREAAERAVELAQAHSVKVSLAAGLRGPYPAGNPPRSALALLLKAADIIFLNEEEARSLTGQPYMTEAVARLLESKPGRIVVLMQADGGCSVHTHAGSETVAGFGDAPIDRSGTSEAFMAGFLVSWVQGEGIGEAAKFATACYALAAQSLGPLSGARSLDDVRFFIQERML